MNIPYPDGNVIEAWWLMNHFFAVSGQRLLELLQLSPKSRIVVIGLSAVAVKRTRLNMTEFYAYHLMTRVGTDVDIVELLHSAGKLFQPYAVDVFAKVESSRLDWVLRCCAIRTCCEWIQ